MLLLRVRIGLRPAERGGEVRPGVYTRSARTVRAGRADVVRLVKRFPVAIRRARRPQSNANAQYNMLLPGQMYTPRLTYFDFRVAKCARMAGTRTQVGFDLYNLFNSNTATALQPELRRDVPAADGDPEGRLARFNVTVDF